MLWILYKNNWEWVETNLCCQIFHIPPNPITKTIDFPLIIFIGASTGAAAGYIVTIAVSLLYPAIFTTILGILILNMGMTRYFFMKITKEPITGLGLLGLPPTLNSEYVSEPIHSTPEFGVLGLPPTPNSECVSEPIHSTPEFGVLGLPPTPNSETTDPLLELMKQAELVS